MGIRKKIIIGLNLYFVMLAGYFQLAEYIRLQTPHEPEPICADVDLATGILVTLALVIVSGIFAILLQLINGSSSFCRGLPKYLVNYLIEPVTILHATICGLLGIAGLFFGIAKLILHPGDLDNITSEVFATLHVAAFAILGILTILEIRKNQLPDYSAADQILAGSIPDKRLM